LPKKLEPWGLMPFSGLPDGPFQTHLAFVEKLLGAKSFDTMIQMQSEYAKTSYAAFVAQACKMGELCSNLAKAGCKPTELAMANMQRTKYN
jgi:hypothetical protein